MADDPHDSICLIVMDVYLEQARRSLDAVGRNVRSAITTCIREAAKEQTEERRTNEFTRCLAQRAGRSR